MRLVARNRLRMAVVIGLAALVIGLGLAGWGTTVEAAKDDKSPDAGSGVAYVEAPEDGTVTPAVALERGDGLSGPVSFAVGARWSGRGLRYSPQPSGMVGCLLQAVSHAEAGLPWLPLLVRCLTR